MMEEQKKFENGKLKITMHTMGTLFFFSIFFMPDYFGIKIGVALNMQRILLIIIWVWIFKVEFRKKQMMKIILTNKTNPFILLYLFVCFYTMVYRTDIGTFMNPLIDYIAVFFTTIYFMKYEWNLEEFLKLITKITCVLCILGIFEAIIRRPIFGVLEFIPGMSGGAMIRDGVYRVSGPAHHPLGYGLFLLIVLPIICYNYKKNEIDIFKNLLLVFLIIVNVFLTGSRSTLGIMAIEIFLLIVFSKKEDVLKYVITGILLTLLLLLLTAMFYDTALVQKILGRLFITIDAAIGTNLAHFLNIHSETLKDSTQYRTYLPMIFKLDWLNPFIGRGTSYKFGWHVANYWIISIDNFYVNQYIKIAYPGLISIILVFIVNIKNVFEGLLKSRNVWYKILLVIFVAYFINLWWVDALGTLDYIFVLFGILYVQVSNLRRREKCLKLD